MEIVNHVSVYRLNIITHVFSIVFADREKRAGYSSSGDEPGQELTCVNGAAALKITSKISDDGEYVPTVGRWGSEWPS